MFMTYHAYYIQQARDHVEILFFPEDCWYLLKLAIIDGDPRYTISPYKEAKYSGFILGDDGQMFGVEYDCCCFCPRLYNMSTFVASDVRPGRRFTGIVQKIGDGLYRPRDVVIPGVSLESTNKVGRGVEKQSETSQERHIPVGLNKFLRIDSLKFEEDKVLVSLENGLIFIAQIVT
jgi:hypothetical protein